MLVNKRTEPHWAGDRGPTSPSLMASVSCPDFMALAGESSDPADAPWTDPGVAGVAGPCPPGPGSQGQIVFDLRLAVGLPGRLVSLLSPLSVVKCLHSSCETNLWRKSLSQRGGCEIENTRDPGLRQMWTLQLTRWRGFSEPPQGCPEPPAPPLCLFRPPGTHKFSDSVSSSGLTCPEQPSLSSRKPDRSQRSPARNVGTVLGPLSPPPSGHRETLSPDYLSPPSPLPPATHCLPVPAKPPDPRV